MHGISYHYTMQMRRYVEREHRRKEMGSHMPSLEDLPEGDRGEGEGGNRFFFFSRVFRCFFLLFSRFF